MTTITIALCQEDRVRLDKIIEALEQTQTMPTVAPVVSQDTPKSKTEEETIPETAEPAENQETVEPAEEVPAPEEAAEEPVKVVSLSDIQKKVVELSAAGKKAEVRDVITKYANRVSAIPAEHTAEVWSQLIGLEN